MKKTLSTCEIAAALINDENANWSRAGAFALAEYLEELETDCGTEQELDVVAFRCEFSEFKSLIDWANGYWGAEHLWDSSIVSCSEIEDEREDCEEEIREYIQENGMLIEFDGGVIVSSF